MRAAVIGLLADGSVNLELESKYNKDLPAIHVEEVHTLDGGSIYEGTAAGRHHTEQQVAMVGEGFITDEREETTEEIVTDFVADPQGGWVGIDTSKAEFLWNIVQTQTGSMVERALIDVDGLAEQLGGEETATWQIGWSGGDDHAGSVYHEDAEMHAAEGPLSQFGFSTEWRGRPIRGTVAASGYVAAFHGLEHAEAFAQFVRDVVLPHCSLPESEQQFLSDVTGGDA